jgi:hypothetical protein
MSNTKPSSRFKRLLLPAIVVLAVVLVVAGAAAFMAERRNAANVNKLFGGPDGLKPILEPEKVEAYRVARPTAAGEPLPGALRVEMVSGPVVVDDKTVRELAAILKSPATYDWDSSKGCIFDPGVMFRFIGEESSTEVVFCFSCNELQVYRNGQRGKGEDFDNARGRLASIMKRVFPDDEEIQKL